MWCYIGATHIHLVAHGSEIRVCDSCAPFNAGFIDSRSTSIAQSCCIAVCTCIFAYLVRPRIFIDFLQIYYGLCDGELLFMHHHYICSDVINTLANFRSANWRVPRSTRSPDRTPMFKVDSFFSYDKKIASGSWWISIFRWWDLSMLCKQTFLLTAHRYDIFVHAVHCWAACIGGPRSVGMWRVLYSFFTWTSIPLLVRHLFFFNDNTTITLISSTSTFKYRGHACVKNTFRALNLKLTPTLQSAHRRRFRHRIFPILLHSIIRYIPISFQISPAYFTCITFREILEEREVKPELRYPSATRKSSQKFSSSTSAFRSFRFTTCLTWLGIPNQIRFSLIVLPLRRTWSKPSRLHLLILQHLLKASPLRRSHCFSVIPNSGRTRIPLRTPYRHGLRSLRYCARETHRGAASCHRKRFSQLLSIQRRTKKRVFSWERLIRSSFQSSLICLSPSLGVFLIWTEKFFIV